MLPIQIDLDLDPRINLATQQNDVPVIKRLRLTNRTETPLTALRVEVIVDPAVAPAWRGLVEGIDAGATYNIEDIDLELSADTHTRQLERERGRLTVEVHDTVVDTAVDTLAGRVSQPIEILAYNEWSGASSLPELLAAFVMPNHPAIALAMQVVRNRLEASGLEPHIDGYQSGDPLRVDQYIQAAYDSIHALGLAYANPPASFEKDGQKVRTPDQILDDTAATCLDLAVFVAGI